MRLYAAAVALVTAAMVGVGLAVIARPSAPRPLAPRAIHLGEEECDRCHMIVSDARYAVERVLGPDDVKVYDDPGCCLETLARDRSGAIFFAETATGDWLPLAESRFERTGRPTPMGYGLAVVRASRAGAGALDVDAAIAMLTSATRR